MPDVANRTCSVDGCNGKHKARGYCSAHYQRRNTGGDLSRLVGERRGCSVDGCAEPHRGHGFCAMHYQRWLRNGEPGEAAVRVEFDLPMTTCEGCGNQFSPATHRQQFCTRTCQDRVWQRARLDIATPEQIRQCGYCESDFSHLDGRRLYCSDECATIAKSLGNAKFLYGITMQEYRAFWLRQQGVCAICARPERTQRNRLLAIDHDHGTGHIRGLLCSHCNRAIGLLDDDPMVIESAARYVRKTRRPLAVVPQQPSIEEAPDGSVHL